MMGGNRYDLQRLIPPTDLRSVVGTLCVGGEGITGMVGSEVSTESTAPV